MLRGICTNYKTSITLSSPSRMYRYSCTVVHHGLENQGCKGASVMRENSFRYNHYQICYLTHPLPLESRQNVPLLLLVIEQRLWAQLLSYTAKIRQILALCNIGRVHKRRSSRRRVAVAGYLEDRNCPTRCLEKRG